ncbi:SRPBCC family protein [Actinotalea fermentans]|uniref:Polyketide cyclase n=1 Tax=Actinotalea fermentans TaxID=43671 RepID=A0A511YXI8_9CELL|nr:SRPBCC family protein [Actinotalea fermentans]KGM15948.1 hypothetical protein N867_04265 [Actinotalea fermentans ATCC 43279 = JCM 9966 = DSM 3133]GEN79924.1 hypothetical protein AFE02nite_16580 [Actinotalea fermentans]
MSRRASATTHLPIPAERAWDLVTDVRNHARWVPFTRIDAPHPLRVGDRFSAATGPAGSLHRLALVDRMEVTATTSPTTAPPAPGRAVYRKLGPVLLGGAEVLVEPAGPDASDVTWVEDIHLRGLPRWAVAWISRPLATLMVRGALRKVRAEVAAGVGNRR